MLLLLALLSAAPLVAKLSVSFEGPGFTSAAAVRRLMTTREGEAFDDATLARDLARLRTLGVLYGVAARVEDVPAGKQIKVEANDRWTLLPVIGLRRGGGRTTARVGITDHNAFGQLFTLYGELNSNADVPFLNKRSGDRLGNYVYADVPRIFGTRLSPALYWTRDFLDYAAFRRDGAVASIFDRARYEGRLETRYELTPQLSAVVGAAARKDRYRGSDVSPAVGTIPRGGDSLVALLGFQLGFVEQDVSQLHGMEARLVFEGARAGVLGSDFDALNALASARGYFLIGARHNLCLQLFVSLTSSKEESFMFRAGGLREIRGFTDSYFVGGLLLRSNAEWRTDVVRGRLVIPFVGQLAAFTDGGYVGRREGAVSGLAYEGPVMSVGAGVRFIPVPFASAVARVDFATGLVPRRTFDVSFSGQQFF